MNPWLSHPEHRRRVLMVDESADSRRAVRQQLAAEDLGWAEAADAEEGFRLAQAEPPDLILLDMALPGSGDFELFHRLKSDPRARATPVVFLSSEGTRRDMARGLDLGAADFLLKPCDPVELRARVRAALRTKELQDLLEQRAHLDGLTGLGNRHALDERLEAEWANCRRRRAPISVLVADIDHFKQVNDAHGHAGGDAVLCAVAGLWQSLARAGDLVARYGGEEFVVVAPDADLRGAVAMAERHRAEVAALLTPYQGRTLHVTVSLGVASTSDVPRGRRPGHPNELIRLADRSLYQAKAAGRNAVWAWDHRAKQPLPAMMDAAASA